jgi:hypothetical protein
MARTNTAEAVSIERYGVVPNQNERGTCTVFIDASVAADAVGGHTPTTTLRAGLVLTRISASGLYAHFDSSAVDGRANEEHAVVLQYDIDLTRYGSSNDIEAGVQYSGPVSLAQLLVGSGFVTADAKNLTFVPNANLDSIG